jgi:methylenetetrahydrofolate reductase (NADPH)
MKLRDIYRSPSPVFSFEFFPPKSDRAEKELFATIEELKLLNPGFFSMTYGAGGSTREKTVALADAIRRAGGVETVCHLTCVGQSRAEIAAIIEEIKALGMENVMALRGDPPRGQTDWTPHPDGFRYASELVEEIRRHGDFSIAVAGFPEVHPDSKNREDDLKFLKLKIDKGADVVVTQLFFRNADYFAFVRDLRDLGVTIPIVPGVMPILSLEQVRRFCATCGATLPAEIERALEERDRRRRGHRGLLRQARRRPDS